MNRNIALIGNPNCGKTTIFNNLTGAKQKVGNWPGVTVEKKTGEYSHENSSVNITDLPGIYSLTPAPQNDAIDQQITNNFVKSNAVDLYINILDATNLKRNLYLTLQLISLGLPCLVVINMIDKAAFQKLNIDDKKLSAILDCPVITISSTQNSKDNTARLKNIINQSLSKLGTKQPTAKKLAFVTPERINSETLSNDELSLNTKVLSSEILQQLNIVSHQLNLTDQTLTNLTSLDTIIRNLLAMFNKDCQTYNYGQILQLLETDETLLAAEVKDMIHAAKHQIFHAYQEDSDIIIADLRYQLIHLIYQGIIIKPAAESQAISAKNKRNFKLDDIILNKYLGIPIFLFILYSIFELSISLGEVFKPFFEIPSGFVTEYLALSLSHFIGLSENLSINLSQGLATGVTTVAGFIPQITLMFILLTYLEDSGYMARAAFVMDRLMQFAGLPGKSFVPLIISFGCNVPAILSTRTLNSPRDRILTCLMSPFMSCSARLAIFIVFASAFFPAHQGLMVFLLYITGILIAILTGLLLKNTILTDKPAPFILELPSYNLPTLKNICIATTQRCKGFIVRAGKLIIPICIALQLLNSLQINGQWIERTNNQNTEQSILSQAGKMLTPLLHPIGVTDENWPATVGLITGSLAKEVVIGTLNTLYSSTEQTLAVEQTDHSFWEQLAEKITEAKTQSYELLANLFSSNHYSIANKQVDEDDFSQQSFARLHEAFPSTWAAFAYCLFVLLYMPCLSTFSILMKEIGRNWAIASLIWSLDIAYLTATLTYQLSLAAVSPIQTFSVINLLLISHLLIYKFLQSGRLNRYFINLNSAKNINDNFTPA